MRKIYKYSAVFCAAMLLWGSSASAQCKLEDMFNKYKVDSRCNSVNMGKAMLDIVMKQKGDNFYGRPLDDLKSISSVKILSVKIPGKSSYYGGIDFSNEGFPFADNVELPEMPEMPEMPDMSDVAEIKETTNTDSLKAYIAESKAKAKERIMERKAKREADLKVKAAEYSALSDAVYKDALGCVSTSAYTEMMSISDKGKQVTYYAKEMDGLVKEFVVLTKSSKEFSMIIVVGSDIKISSISLLGELVPNANINLDLN